MIKEQVRQATTDDLRARLTDLDRGLARYISIGIGVLDTEQDPDPALLQEKIWIQNELMIREALPSIDKGKSGDGQTISEPQHP